MSPRVATPQMCSLTRPAHCEANTRSAVSKCIPILGRHHSPLSTKNFDVCSHDCRGIRAPTPVRAQLSARPVATLSAKIQSWALSGLGEASGTQVWAAIVPVGMIEFCRLEWICRASVESMARLVWIVALRNGQERPATQSEGGGSRQGAPQANSKQPKLSFTSSLTTRSSPAELLLPKSSIERQ